MSTDLISDFYLYCSSYEIPRNYAIWSALGLLGAVTNKKIYVKQGDTIHTGNMYICLVGAQGNKKSTAMKWSRSIYQRTFTDMPIGSSVQSREAIIRFMASPEGARYFVDHLGSTVEYHPYALFLNEFENFLSFNIPGMVSFLSDIYDSDQFDSSTIIRGLESFPNPAVNMLACCTPKWLISKLRGDIITGGICRRIVFVYEFDARTPDGKIISIPRPVVHADAQAALDRVKEHIKKIDGIRGEFAWTKDGAQFFDSWYHENKKTLPDDPIMQGYRRSKDVQLLKTAMLVALSESEPQLLLTHRVLEIALAYLDAIEKNMPKLSAASGRNELAEPQQRILDLLEEHNGWMTEVDLMRRMEKDLNPAEQRAVFYHLKESEQVVIKRFKVKNVERVLVMTKETYEKRKNDGEIS